MQKKHAEWLRNYYEDTQKLVTTSDGTFVLGITDVDKYGNSSQVNCTGYDNCGRQNAGKWENIDKIICQNLCAVGLTRFGHVFSVGETSCYADEPSDLKLYDFPEVVDIAKAKFATVGLKEDGTVVAIGSNYYGECNVQKFSANCNSKLKQFLSL